MSITRRGPRRRLLAPEVVQTSAMDCGPASLKCLLEGLGIPASYGRLREACQTDVDGTSIDTLETVARDLGLDAEQTMLPADHLLLSEAEALPALVVTRDPGGFTHFLVVWRRHGPWVQVMDPAIGKRWVRADRFLEEVYVHEIPVPAEDWRTWAGTDGFIEPLARRLRALGLGADARKIAATQASAPGWEPLARLDAAARLAEALARSKSVRRGREAEGVLRALLDGAEPPSPCWSARAAPDPGQVILRGAVLLRVHGRLAAPERARESLSPELEAALSEPPTRPLGQILGMLRGDGPLAIGVLLVALAAIAGATALEAVLLRGALELGRDLGLLTQRMEAAGAFLAFAAALLLLELGAGRMLLRLGRRLEARLRLRFFEKVPRLPDRYFQSRPVSDMAERGHAIHRVRELPRLAGELLRAVLGLAVTAAAIGIIFPTGAPVAVIAALASVGIPWLFLPALAERDLRLRTHAGALCRFYFDALLGLAAVRAHAGEGPLRREHEGLTVEWARAGRRLLRAVVLADGLQALAGLGFAFLIVHLHAARASDSPAALLLAYWALSLPVLGEQVALLLRQYPAERSATLRLLEPLAAGTDAREGEAAAGRDQRAAKEAVASPRGEAPKGVAISIDGVSVLAAGRIVLEDVTLELEPGEHVAIVGPSGAGKSSLAGLLLGWHRPARGSVLVDGEPLDAARLDRLRRETVWVDPAVQLWNRSLLENLLYGEDANGAAEDPEERLARSLAGADLHRVIERLPEGLQTHLGEGGGLVSGGEGQRVRLGRGMGRPAARLAILDEPFRGLDRAQRGILLERSRDLWRRATLLVITHDVAETRAFDRVLFIEGGRLVEEGAPQDLLEDPSSRYRALAEAEEEVREGIWSRGAWRRLRLDGGKLVEDGGMRR